MEENNKNHPPSPFAKYKGLLQLGDIKIECYVLDTEQRVMSLRAVVKAIAGVDSGSLTNYLGVQALTPFLSSKFVPERVVEFYVPGFSNQAKGITAEDFLDICDAYVKALKAGALQTERQREIAMQCSILSTACAKIGLIAMIDEATGYQYIRQENALQLKLKLFIAEEMREWEKTFPDELWEEFGRLDNWSRPLHERPKWWGKLVMELIYEALDKDIADYLRNNKPTPIHGCNYHQWLTENYGLSKLIAHINQIIGIAKTCSNMSELREKVAYHYKHGPLQKRLFDDYSDLE
jgi:hypothetical protein